MGISIGIDLGSDKVKVAYRKNELENINNIYAIKSGFAIDEKNIILGKEENYKISSVKNIIGTDTKLNINSQEFNGNFILGAYLKGLKDFIEEKSGQIIEKAIIAVPYDFSIDKRKECIDAINIAGIKNAKIVSETNAIMNNYKNINLTGKNLICDLGKSSIKLTIVDNDDLKFLGKYSDENFSGEKVNQILKEAIISLFKTSTDKSIDIESAELMDELNKSIEKAKKNLSFKDSENIFIKNIIKDKGGKHFDLNLSIRKIEFEHIINQFTVEFLNVVNKFLINLNLGKSEINKVILVGASFNIPIIKSKIESVFSGKVINQGAYESLIANGANIENENNMINEFNEISRGNIGVEIKDGLFDLVIEKGSKLPVSVCKKYRTIENFQEIAEVKIYEGEEEITAENKLLGKFDIEQIPKDNMGNQHIELCFNYSENGILEINSNILSNSRKEKNIISINGLNEEGINIIEENLKQFNFFCENSEELSASELLGLKSKEAKKEMLRAEDEEFKKREELRIKNENERLRAIQEAKKNEELRVEREVAQREQIRIEEARKKEELRVKIEEAEKERLRIAAEEARKKEELRIKSEEAKREREESEAEKVNNCQEKETKSEDLENKGEESGDDIYQDIARLVAYYKNVYPELNDDVKKAASDLLSDLLGLIKANKISEARIVEDKIVALIYKE